MTKKLKKAINDDSAFVGLFRNGDEKCNCLCNGTVVARINGCHFNLTPLKLF